MNESAARQAIKIFVEDNRETLLEDLIAQGVYRTFTATTNLFTPPVSYYWIIIHCESAEDRQRYPNKQDAFRATYNIAVEVADYAIPNMQDDEIYDESDRQFRVFCDRLVNAIESAEEFYDEDETNKFTIVRSDTAPIITKQNVDTLDFDESGTLVGLILASVIRFRIEGC